jgi:mersacidin/lichenicidin family type 2 lantibiotic
MESMHAWQGLEDRKSVRTAARPADPAGALVLTEEELRGVVGGIGQDSDPCEGGEGRRH